VLYHMLVADPRSGIQCLFDPWIRDPGLVKKSRSRSGMNIPDHISESLETFFWVKKILQFFDADADPGSGIFNPRDNPDHISESLETIFWVKILKFLDADADPGSF
jgi:hypothetical protein